MINVKWIADNLKQGDQVEFTYKTEEVNENLLQTGKRVQRTAKRIREHTMKGFYDFTREYRDYGDHVIYIAIQKEKENIGQASRCMSFDLESIVSIDFINEKKVVQNGVSRVRSYEEQDSGHAVPTFKVSTTEELEKQEIIEPVVVPEKVKETDVVAEAPEPEPAGLTDIPAPTDTPEPEPAEKKEKRFPCDFPGCTKDYANAGALWNHKHKPGVHDHLGGA